MWYPSPDFDKVLSSLMFGSTLSDVRWHYLRACALRLDAYGNTRCRNVLSDYIDYLNNNHSDYLVGSVTQKGVIIQMSEIKSIWKSDEWIDNLYSGKESNSNEVIDISAQQHLIKLINYTEEYDLSQDPIFTNQFTSEQYSPEIKQSLTMSKVVKKTTKTVTKAPRSAFRGKRQNKQANKQTHNNHKRKSKLSSVGPVRGSRFANTGIARFSRVPTARDYLRALTDPFNAPAPKLGFDCFVPTAKHGTWFEKTSIAPGATATGCFIMCQPTVAAGVFIAPFTAAQLGTAFTTITYSTSSMTNSSQIQAVAQAGRIINWAIRVKVRTAGTNMQGTLGAALISRDSLVNIMLLTPNSFTQLPNYRACESTNSAAIGGEVQYRPVDVTDFAFNVTSVGPAGFATTAPAPNLCFLANGWSVTAWDLEISIIGHIETMAGVDAAGEQDNEPDLVDSGATIDSLSSMIVRAGEPVVTAITALSEAKVNIDRQRGSRTMGGMLASLGGNSVTLAKGFSINEESKSEETEITILKKELENEKLKTKRMEDLILAMDDASAPEIGEVPKAVITSAAHSYTPSLLQSFIARK
jgi:hypothetical protein